jgi:hypothetical protein
MHKNIPLLGYTLCTYILKFIKIVKKKLESIKKGILGSNNRVIFQ